MKRILLFLLMLMSGLLIYAGNLIPANNESIEYTGRIDFSKSEAPQFSYSGVSIRTGFKGKRISAVLEDEKGENVYNIILDGEVVKKIATKKGKHTYLLARGLDDTNHEIEIFKRTELVFGKTRFHGFELAKGGFLIPVSNERQLFIEYIGNSITCGYGNEGVNGDTFGPETENHYMTYAAITSRNFNARHMAVSKSGIGVYRNYDGPVGGSPDCLTNLYDRIFLYDDEPRYDFAMQPDVVCINLGTNDFSTVGGDSALYVSNYLRLIDTIQTKYNHPRIVCLLGPMMNEEVLDKVRGYVNFVAETASDKGLGPVTFFEMSAQTGELGIGVDTHPTVAQHQKNAAELTAYLADLMDWEVAFGPK